MSNHPHTPRETHGIHQDEAIRDRREKRATARAIADERLLAGRRIDALLPYSYAPMDMVEDPDFPGCVW